MHMRPTRTVQALAGLAVASLALTACGSGGSSDSDSDSSSQKSSSSDAAASVKKDGKLVVGSLLPQTGDLAFLGPPEFAGVQTAVDDINDAGGVLGKPVTQIKADSGDGTPDIAGAQVDKLLAGNADVVLGAAASGVSLSVINKITDAGRVEFSPANTSPAFDDAKTDPHSLYFRTAPSDVLQGAVLANTILEDGKQNVAILARQDSYGELLAKQVEKGIEDGGGTVATKVLYSADAQNFTAEVNKVAATKPDAIALIAFNETTKIIPAMVSKGIGPAAQQIYFVDGNTADYSKDFPKGTLKGVKATYPGAELKADFKARLLKTDSSLKDFTYGPESYDATVLTALAAVAAKSDSPTDFNKEIINVSEGGEKCTTYKQCADLLADGTDIDYDGVSGPVDLGKTGSPTKATIGIFQYGADNNYTNLKYVTGAI
ncbi:branched-chain amino acid ABC transporter substrate-binding protein [Marmoricola endophyticus]|uniref:Branched-chain amino acid ABC transporter substrate-binding protein n=2 Tax=Marmoricola endophyticus TaxID=2040280 RepID=A0A917EYI2_9ACTN|nr:branched-chain amino acid ABC transporter substrate-binding protein [Marmoricola endophyticus]